MTRMNTAEINIYHLWIQCPIPKKPKQPMAKQLLAMEHNIDLLKVKKPKAQAAFLAVRMEATEVFLSCFIQPSSYKNTKPDGMSMT
jgi:hypothetical protein